MSRPQKTVIIAEAGVNHNGDIRTALELVDEASNTGADFVKFQTFKADKLASKSAEKANYQKSNGDIVESQLEMLRKLELSPHEHQRLIDQCAKRGIGFLTSAFDHESLRFITSDLGIDTVKFGSGELTNSPLLFDAARRRVKILLSTGMSSLSEIEEALGVIAFGLMRQGDPSDRGVFFEVLLDPSVWPILAKFVTLFHCTTEYPAPIEDTNLRSIETMRQAFGLSVGYSDHTESNSMSIAAVARGATMIEKHFTLDRSLAGPDHSSSLEPKAFKALVDAIREVEMGLGNGIKIPTKSEISNRKVVRKVIVATRSLCAGQIIESGDISVKRAPQGLAAIEFWDCIGRKLSRNVMVDEAINKCDLL